MKKNLKRTEAPTVEDVFECFSNYVEELTQLVEEPRDPKTIDVLDLFHPFRHNFHVPEPRLADIDILNTTNCIPSLDSFDCGRPTFKAIQVKAAKNKVKLLEYKKTQKESSKVFKTKKALAVKKAIADKKDANLPKWQSLLTTATEVPKKPKAPKPKIEYKAESIFEEWIQNLEEPKYIPATPKSPKLSPKSLKKKAVIDLSCENFFQDWLHNLNEVVQHPKKIETSFAFEVDFEDFKNNRRADFAKIAKIKDKKRTQAERRSTGRRIK